MQFLKILFWCLLAFVAALFTYGNWNGVPIHLWNGLIADVNLPLLLLVTFLIGFVPTHLYHAALRWRLRQRLATTERVLADTRMAITPLSASPAPDPGNQPVPPPAASPAATAAADPLAGQLL